MNSYHANRRQSSDALDMHLDKAIHSCVNLSVFSVCLEEAMATDWTEEKPWTLFNYLFQLAKVIERTFFVSFIPAHEKLEIADLWY